MILEHFSHFMQVWLLPPGLIILFMLTAYLFSFFSKKFANVLQMVSLILFLILSVPQFTQQLIAPLQNQYAPLKLKNLSFKDHSAIVILGAGIDRANEYSNKHVLSEMTFKRLHYAAHLYAHHPLPIFVSGGNRDKEAETEASLMRKTLEQSYHIPTRGEETQSKNTKEEAEFMIPLLKQQQIKIIYLVTHAWHMPRSMYSFTHSFAKAGITIIPAPTGYISLLSAEKFANYLPSLKALNASAYAIHEYIGLIWYHLITY